MTILAIASILLLGTSHSVAFRPPTALKNTKRTRSPALIYNNEKAALSSSTSQLNLFDKIFEEEGILGKGITVGKVQVALNSPSRGADSIFGILEAEADDDKSLPELTNAICLALLRKRDDWIGSTGTSEWFGQDDAGKAESKFNEFANKEAAKFEKEYIPGGSSEEKGGGATIVVVSLVIEIEGDSTTFDTKYTLTGTQEVLSSIASDCMVDDGDCLNAVEIFWCPSDRKEVLSRIDMITDFPEIIDL